MCELLEEPLSDTDEENSQQNLSNAFLRITTNYHIGNTLESCMTEVELGRVCLSCHFTADCPSTLAITSERLDLHNVWMLLQANRGWVVDAVTVRLQRSPTLRLGSWGQPVST